MRWFCCVLCIGAVALLSPAVAQQEGKPAFSVKGPAWAKEVLTDPGKAAAKYVGKKVEVTGSISSATPFFNPRGITLHGDKLKPSDPFALFIDCDLQKELVEKGWLLARNQKVKVTGEVTKADKDRIVLTNCTFTELEKNPTPTVTARDLVAAYLKNEGAAGVKYGNTMDRKDVFITGVVAEVREARAPYKLLRLEGDGKIFIEGNIRNTDAEGLKKGDSVTLRADCSGLIKQRSVVACDGHLIKK